MNISKKTFGWGIASAVWLGISYFGGYVIGERFGISLANDLFEEEV